MTDSEYLQVFEKYRMYIFYFCRKIIDNTAEAEDITVIVFLKLWNNKEKVQMDKAKAFLLITANHKCQDYIKIHSRYEAVLNSFSFSDMEMINTENDVLNYLYTLVLTLPPQEQKMVLLKYYLGKEVKEIAKVLQLSAQTVSNTLNAGIRKLREMANKKPTKNSGLSSKK